MVFHSADCESGYGDFRGVQPEERDKLHIDLTSMLANSGLIGWGLAIDLKGLGLAFPETLTDQVPNSCFFRTMLFHVDRAHANYPGQPLRIVFDRNKKTEHNSRLLFEYLAEESDPDKRELLPLKPEFLSREEIGVQSSDLWARELMKYLDGILFSSYYKPSRAMEHSVEDETIRGRVAIRVLFPKHERQMATLEEKTGMNKEKYTSWLLRKKRQDSQSNRVEYMKDVAARDRSMTKTVGIGS